MGTISLGDTVTGEGQGSGTVYEGVVLSLAQPGTNPKIRVTKIRTPKVGSAIIGRPVYITNMKKVENQMQYVKNLIGPKPEPVKEPKFTAPFRADGRNVLDSGGKVVVRVQFGGYTTAAYRSELPMAEAYELAGVIARALTEKYEVTVKDSNSPF